MDALFDTFALPVAGGALIGLSATLLLFTTGRTAGISGILGGGIVFPKGDTFWRWSFIAGLVVGGLICLNLKVGPRDVFGPAGFKNTLDLPWLAFAAGGLLVGIGTRLGSGCTSGHGICGLSRFSPRSLVAVVTFIASGIAMTFLVHHVIGA